MATVTSLHPAAEQIANGIPRWAALAKSLQNCWRMPVHVLGFKAFQLTNRDNNLLFIYM